MLCGFDRLVQDQELYINKVDREEKMKKRILAIICIVCLLIAMMPTAIFAAAYTAPTLSIDAVQNEQEKTVEVNVKLGACTDLGGLDFHLKYDTSKLEVSSYLGADEFGNEDYTTISSNDDNIGLSFVKSSGLTMKNEKTILTVMFKVKEDAYGKATIAFDEDVTNFSHKNGDDTSNAPALGSVLSRDIMIKKSPITSAAVSVEQPVKGAVLATTVNTNNATAYTADIKWFEGTSASGTNVTGKAKAEQIYTAKITLTADSDNGENFAKGAAFNVPDGYKVVSNDGTTVVLTKTFQKTASKSVTEIEITTQPTKKTYTHGDSFNAAGMVVKAVYDDGSEDADFKAYEVVYANEGKSYLKYKDNKVTLKVGDVADEVTGLKVNKKELEITGLKAVNRKYDGTTKVSFTGGTLVGAVAGEDVTAAIPAEGTVTDGSVGTKAVTATTPDLTGADADCYTLKEITGIKVQITAADIPDAVADAIKGYNGE